MYFSLVNENVYLDVLKKKKTLGTGRPYSFIQIIISWMLSTIVKSFGF